MKDFKPDRKVFLGYNNIPVVQGMFLEVNYDVSMAVYTLKDVDYEYEGKTYPSLKRLYIEMDDVTEYDFANKYLLGWQHWKRLCENKMIRKHIDEWREELELKVRSRAIRDMQNLCAGENGNFGAAKFLADRGWDKRAAGRPSKKDIEKNAAIAAHVADEFAGDVKRLEDYRK